MKDKFSPSLRSHVATLTVTKKNVATENPRELGY